MRRRHIWGFIGANAVFWGLVGLMVLSDGVALLVVVIVLVILVIGMLGVLMVGG